MLNSISWQAYWTAIALLSAGYYVIVYLMLFRKGMDLFYSAEKTSGLSFQKAASPNEHSYSIGEPEPDFSVPQNGTPEHLVYACVDELNAFIQQSKSVKIERSQFLESVRAILSKYPTIHATEYRETISRVLLSEAAHHCSIHISKEEVDSVWLGPWM